MIKSKYINRIVYVLVAFAFLSCLSLVLFSGLLTEKAVETDGKAVAMKYETELFDTAQIMEVNIIMDEAEWQDMLENAISEEYYRCDVEINGNLLNNVAIRPKGNTSLSSIASDADTERYSLKLEFDRYVEGQTCMGLDKLILNNNYADATNMKEAIVYDMYQYLGADASLYNYARISVNGEYWGVYLALEAVEDSFMMRNYGTEKGYLYKPETMEMGGGNGGGFGSGNGADLTYTDDDTDSYSAIWDGAINETTDADHKRVVKALANISSGTDLEQYMDIDNLLKYMAVHAFVVNEDSFTKSMSHNYYLYESSGRLNIIPWDYNLAFGGMGSNGATDVINDPIDTPFSGTEFFDTLMENEEYLAQYHEYLRRLTEDYVYGGGLETAYNRIRSQIDELVDTDPTAFYTYGEYDEGAAMLYQTMELRADSIKGQLEGSIPSTTQGQRGNADTLVDASEIDIDTMGTMNMGGGNGRGGFGKEMNGNMEKPTGGQRQEMNGGNMGNMEMPSDMEEMFGGEMSSEMSGDTVKEIPGDMSQEFQGEQSIAAGNFSGMRGMNGMQGQSTAWQNLMLYGVCLLVAVIALIIATKYKRK